MLVVKFKRFYWFQVDLAPSPIKCGSVQEENITLPSCGMTVEKTHSNTSKKCSFYFNLGFSSYIIFLMDQRNESCFLVDRFQQQGGSWTLRKPTPFLEDRSFFSQLPWSQSQNKTEQAPKVGRKRSELCKRRNRLTKDFLKVTDCKRDFTRDWHYYFLTVACYWMLMDHCWE